jgi:hypothetical protein
MSGLLYRLAPLLALAERLRFHAATWLALHPNFPAVAADMNAAADALLGADTDRMIAQAEADQLRAALAKAAQERDAAREALTVLPAWYSYRPEDWRDAARSIALKLRENAEQVAALMAERDKWRAFARAADALRAALAAEPEATWPLNAAAEPDREPFDGTPEDFGHEDCEVCNAARALRAPVEREATDEEVARELVGIWEDTAGIEPRTRPLVQELDRALVWVRAVRAATVRAQEGR